MESNNSLATVEEPSESGTTPPQTTRPQVTFMGNSYDLMAVVAAVTGVTVALSCLTCGTVSYCLPIFAIIMGVVGLVSARDSIDASRTQLLSWVGIGGGAIMLALLIIGMVIYFLIIALAIMADQAQ